MCKELYLGNNWVAYFMIHKLTKPLLGFTIGSTRIDIDLLYISLGIWR